MKPVLLLLTNQFPLATAKAENWLYDELSHTHTYFEKIIIVPDSAKETCNALPTNCQTQFYNDLPEVKLTTSELINSLRIVLSDFSAYPKKSAYLKQFRYNFSLVRQLHLKAKRIAQKQEWFSKSTIIYPYWADNLCTTASLVKQRYHNAVKIVTRGHGYEIFEDQTLHKVIPFRHFQYRFIDAIFADSKRGRDHLMSKKENIAFKHKNEYAYVGTKDYGFGAWQPDSEFTIATCSFVRNVKRLDLMPDILKYIPFPLTWHVLGGGDDLEKLKGLTKSLSSNIKVIYHGELSNEAILKFYSTHSINLLVSLSSSEGLPVTMMEAQSFGIPILSTDVGGCREICHEETGFLIDRDFNPEVVANKMEAFKNSSKNTEVFRKQCRRHWEENFNAKTNYANFANLLVN